MDSPSNLHSDGHSGQGEVYEDEIDNAFTYSHEFYVDANEMFQTPAYDFKKGWTKAVLKEFKHGDIECDIIFLRRRLKKSSSRKKKPPDFTANAMCKFKNCKKFKFIVRDVYQSKHFKFEVFETGTEINHNEIEAQEYCNRLNKSKTTKKKRKNENGLLNLKIDTAYIYAYSFYVQIHDLFEIPSYNMKKGWTKSVGHEFYRLNMKCVLSFQRKHFKKEISRKKNSPDFTAYAICKFANCKKYKFIVQEVYQSKRLKFDVFETKVNHNTNEVNKHQRKKFHESDTSNESEYAATINVYDSAPNHNENEMRKCHLRKSQGKDLPNESKEAETINFYGTETTNVYGTETTNVYETETTNVYETETSHTGFKVHRAHLSKSKRKRKSIDMEEAETTNVSGTKTSHYGKETQKPYLKKSRRIDESNDARDNECDQIFFQKKFGEISSSVISNVLALPVEQERIWIDQNVKDDSHNLQETLNITEESEDPNTLTDNAFTYSHEFYVNANEIFQTPAYDYKKGWTKAALKEFKHGDIECDIIFLRRRLKKRLSRKKNIPDFTANAMCKFENCKKFKFVVRDVYQSKHLKFEIFETGTEINHRLGKKKATKVKRKKEKGLLNLKIDGYRYAHSFYIDAHYIFQGSTYDFRKDWTNAVYRKFNQENKKCVLSFSRRHMKKINSRKYNSPDFFAYAFCKFKNCRKFKFIVNDVYEATCLKFEVFETCTEINHNENEVHRRHLKGAERLEMAKRAEEVGATSLHLLSVLRDFDGESKTFRNLTDIPSISVLRNAISEKRKKTRLNPMVDELY